MAARGMVDEYDSGEAGADELAAVIKEKQKATEAGASMPVSTWRSSSDAKRAAKILTDVACACTRVTSKRRAPAQVLPGQARLRARGGALPRADEAVVHHRGRDPPSARGVRENANAPGGAAGGGKTGACRFIARTTPRRARTRETTV